MLVVCVLRMVQQDGNLFRQFRNFLRFYGWLRLRGRRCDLIAEELRAEILLNYFFSQVVCP